MRLEVGNLYVSVVVENMFTVRTTGSQHVAQLSGFVWTCLDTVLSVSIEQGKEKAHSKNVKTWFIEAINKSDL